MITVRRPLSSSSRRWPAWVLKGCLWMMLVLPAMCHAATPSPVELLDNGRADDALRLLIPQATGNNAAAYNFLCRTYFGLRDWDDALRNCEHATQLAPENADFQLWMGRSYGEKANAEPAYAVSSAYSLARKTVAAFESAHALDRHSLPIVQDLAEYYTTAPSIVGGGNGKALTLAAEIAPEYPWEAALIRAMAAAHEDKYELAEREYAEAIRLSSGSAETQLEFARYLRGRKRWQRFQQTVESALRTPNIRPVDRYNAAEMLFRTSRNLPEATRQMRAYIQGGRHDEDAPLFRAHCLLGDILLKTGDSNQAAAEYRAALALASSYSPATEALRRMGQR